MLAFDEGGPRMRVVRSTAGFGDSDPSDVYGATGQRWLVVDGFDRVLGGSYPGFTHAFAADIGNALGEDFSIASNEAVVDGLVDLSDFWGVLWMLGDEASTTSHSTPMRELQSRASSTVADSSSSRAPRLDMLVILDG